MSLNDSLHYIRLHCLICLHLYIHLFTLFQLSACCIYFLSDMLLQKLKENRNNSLWIYAVHSKRKGVVSCGESQKQNEKMYSKKCGCSVYDHSSSRCCH